MVREFDWDDLAPSYAGRYGVNPLAGVDSALGALVEADAPSLSLEVGCGTGRWMATLTGRNGVAIGLDSSLAMLLEGTRPGKAARFLCADGNRLPFGEAAFDLVVSINAAHHFVDTGDFIARCFDLLRPAGTLALVVYDPDRAGQSWYVYDDFPGALEGDLARFPRQDQLERWMAAAGFESRTTVVAETIERHYSGRQVLKDYFLRKDSNSTLARLSDEAYAEGLARLRRWLEEADASGETIRFDVRLELLLLVGRKP